MAMDDSTVVIIMCVLCRSYWCLVRLIQSNCSFSPLTQYLCGCAAVMLRLLLLLPFGCSSFLPFTILWYLIGKEVEKLCTSQRQTVSRLFFIFVNYIIYFFLCVAVMEMSWLTLFYQNQLFCRSARFVNCCTCISACRLKAFVTMLCSNWDNVTVKKISLSSKLHF